MHTHIVYYATYKNIIVYIGSGTPYRINHVTSGTSHVYGLNKHHFTDPINIKTYILKGYCSQEESLQDEKMLILKFKPKYNTQWLETEERFELASESIESFKGEFIPVEKETILRKVLTYLETIELGLEPSVINAIKYYEDPNTDNEKLFNAFPKFKEWLDAGITLSEMNSCGRTRDKIEELVSNKTRLAKATVSFKDFSGYSENMFVTKKELKEKIQAYYNMLGINLKAKSTDIGKYSETENTTKLIESKRENGIRIVRFI